MPKKLTPEVTPIKFVEGQTEDEVMLNNHVLVLNGNRLHLTVKDTILMVRNEVVTDLPQVNTSDDGLSKAISTAWLGLIDNRYPLADRWVHMLHTPEELNAMMVSDWAGYLVIVKDVPYASEIIPASEFVSIPTEPGVYQFEYLMGEYKVNHKMKNSRYVAGEPKWISQQRNTYYKQLAITLLVQGRNINARYFPRIGKYIAKLSETIQIEDPVERKTFSDINIKTAAVKSTEYGLKVYETKLATEGKSFVSAAEVLKLADGTFMAAVDGIMECIDGSTKEVKSVIGHEFDRWYGTVHLISMPVTVVNAQNFLSTCAQHGLTVNLIK